MIPNVTRKYTIDRLLKTKEMKFINHVKKTPTQKTKNECTKIKDFCIIYFPSMVCYGVTTKTPAKITVEGDSSDKCCVHMTVLA